eukprot:4405858-Pyramimonas_sp.AAC.1
MPGERRNTTGSIAPIVARKVPAQGRTQLCALVSNAAVSAGGPREPPRKVVVTSRVVIPFCSRRPDGF